MPLMFVPFTKLTDLAWGHTGICLCHLWVQVEVICSFPVRTLRLFKCTAQLRSVLLDIVCRLVLLCKLVCVHQSQTVVTRTYLGHKQYM